MKGKAAGGERMKTVDDIEYINSISVEDFNRLRKAAGWGEVAPEQVQRGIVGTECLVAAVCKGEAAGMARLISDGGVRRVYSRRNSAARVSGQGHRENDDGHDHGSYKERAQKRREGIRESYGGEREAGIL
jgi:hypothetical protein